MVKKRPIEEDLIELQGKGRDHPLSMGEILELLSHKGELLAILVLSLPFCLPIQIPGFSTPFGLAITFLGLKMIFGKYAWLPKSLLEKKVPEKTLKTIIDNILWLTRKIKRWTYPRLIWLFQNPLSDIFNGLLITFLGLCLALPLPIPFSNLVVAWAIFLLCLGLLEEDGLLVIVGYLVSLIAFIFFAVIAILNWRLLVHIF